MYKPGDRVMYEGRVRVIDRVFSDKRGYHLKPIEGLTRDKNNKNHPDEAYVREVQAVTEMQIGDTVFYQGKPRVITDISPCKNYKLDGNWATGTPEPYKYKIGDRVYYVSQYLTTQKQVSVISDYHHDKEGEKGYKLDMGWMPEDRLSLDTEPQIRVGDKVKFNFSVSGQVTAIHGSGSMVTVAINLPKDAVEKV